MTVRVYLTAVRVYPEGPQPGDLAAERFFVHASDVPECWVETESGSVPDLGRTVTFAFTRPMGLGFGRITGTIERKVRKGKRGDAEAVASPRTSDSSGPPE
ncbi:MAG: hypothetical protein AVDCRST_MAG87-3055 [uncultured Thermomicrobiales bacterium]|uniref:Uncharacterized protein n=1 Tax=uncultured Thermomicrobiales bacterium TaxID=1645740 RepID=A0A6J4VGT0_9BACT|nr:MAG: hypothetical protein AVDCRST_MAG87-3055 [uncultured Thermomicrobiales bacterium]